jgi:hypothetical protein
VFESKQIFSGEALTCAQAKAASVRRLSRTCVSIPTVNGNFRKNPQWILAGFVALDTRKSPDAKAVKRRLEADQGECKLDFGCCASVGTFGCDGADSTTFRLESQAAGRFLMEVMARLQACGTAPAIDDRAYGKWMDAQSLPAGL